MKNLMCKLLFSFILLTFANADESLCEKLKDKDLVQDRLLYEFFRDLSMRRGVDGNLKVGLNFYTKQISANEDTTLCAFYSKLRFNDVELTDEDIKTIKEAFAKQGNFATYEEETKRILLYAKLLKYNNESLESAIGFDDSEWLSWIIYFDGLLQIYTFKMGYLQDSVYDSARDKGREFLDSKDSGEIKDWIKKIDSAK